MPQPDDATLRRKCFAIIGDAGLGDDDRRDLAGFVLGRDVESFTTLTSAEWLRLAERRLVNEATDREASAPRRSLAITDRQARAAIKKLEAAHAVAPDRPMGDAA